MFRKNMEALITAVMDAHILDTKHYIRATALQ
jgi:hypothetical protein